MYRSFDTFPSIFIKSMRFCDIRIPFTYYTQRCFPRIFSKIHSGFHFFNWSVHDCMGNNNCIFRISKLEYFWHHFISQSLIKSIQIQYFGGSFLSICINSILHILLSTEGKLSINFKMRAYCHIIPQKNENKNVSNFHLLLNSNVDVKYTFNFLFL